MALPDRGGHRVTLAEAVALTRRHRRGAGRAVDWAAVRGFALGRDALDAILAQPGCAGVRAYLGLLEDDAPTLVVVGIDESGADLTEGEVMNRVLPCPPFCPPSSALAQ